MHILSHRKCRHSQRQLQQLEHTATHCSTLLKPTAAHCMTLQLTATHCKTLQHTATHSTPITIYSDDLFHRKFPRSKQQTYRTTLQHTAAHGNILLHTATHPNPISICFYDSPENILQEVSEESESTATHCNTL